jgi:hypothetical protein
MGQVECAGRLVVFAGAALGRLLRADEGLLRGSSWTAHIAASGVERGWRSWQLEAVSGVGGHDAPWLRRSALAIVRGEGATAGSGRRCGRAGRDEETVTPEPEHQSAQLCGEKRWLGYLLCVRC